MKSVLMHFYNEEYLLPRWLEHHKKIFDFGVLIDYGSTDNSVAICKEICPNWQVMPTRNAYFDARACDLEIMFYERQIPGCRIALTATEFLVGDVNQLVNEDPKRQQHIIPGIRFTKWDPLGTLDTNKPLWEQIKTGVSYHDDYIAHQGRSFHNYKDIDYPTGRHFGPYTTENVLVFHYAHCIVGKEMIKRRMQIQHKVSPFDREKGIGNHHYVDNNGLTFNRLYDMHKEFIAVNERDCSEYIDRIFPR